MRAVVEALVTTGYIPPDQLEPTLAQLEAVRRSDSSSEQKLLDKLGIHRHPPPADVPGGWTALHSLARKIIKF